MSRAWLPALILVGMLSFSGASVAQGSQPFFQIHADMAERSKTITRDLGSERLYVNVTVRAQSPNPLTDQFSIRLDVTLEPENAPNGFSMSVAGPGNSCRERQCSHVTRPGTTEQFIITVTNTQSDPDQPQVKPALRIRSTPMFEGDPLPAVTGGAVQQMSQTDEERVEGTVALKLDASERVAYFVKQYSWFILAAACGIFVLGVVLVRKRKGGLLVTAEAPVQEVLPGRGASFPIRVTNEGRERETLSLTTSDVPPGWSAILPVDRIDLGPNESTTIWLTLKSPAVAHPGEHVQVNFVITTSEGVAAESLLEAVVVQSYGQRGDGARMAAPPVEPVPEPEPEPAVARVKPKRRAR